jgi:hypothetical protein
MEKATLFFNALTVCSTFAMAIATIVMAMAAWQAKKGFLSEKQFNFGIELQDKYTHCYKFMTEKMLYSTPEEREINIKQNHANIIDLVTYFAKIGFLFNDAENKKIKEILMPYLIYDRELDNNNKESREAFEKILQDYINGGFKEILKCKFKLGEK